MEERLVVVFGSSRTQDVRHREDAERLGALLAESGYAVGTGGYSAIMDWVSKGAYEAGGRVIAYTTDEFPDEMPTQWSHEERRTPDLHLRIQRMLREGDAFVAMWGGVGTLAEVVLAWNVAQFTELYGRPVKPLALLGAHWLPLVESIGSYTEIGDRLLRYPVPVDTPEEAVAYLRGELEGS